MVLPCAEQVTNKSLYGTDNKPEHILEPLILNHRSELLKKYSSY
ncbi:hypothetical protein ACFOGG_02090 [Brenneria rubrifaciens]